MAYIYKMCFPTKESSELKIHKKQAVFSCFLIILILIFSKFHYYENPTKQNKTSTKTLLIQISC